MSDDDPREMLLGQLKRLNVALERHAAVPDITVEEAAGITETATLQHLIDAGARRLTLIAETLSRSTIPKTPINTPNRENPHVNPPDL